MIGIVEVACFRGEYRSHAAHEDHVDLAASESGDVSVLVENVR